jgi:hypothetical protein
MSSLKVRLIQDSKIQDAKLLLTFCDAKLLLTFCLVILIRIRFTLMLPNDRFSKAIQTSAEVLRLGIKRGKKILSASEPVSQRISRWHLVSSSDAMAYVRCKIN